MSHVRMTSQRPQEDALCWFVNGADQPVDVYVNYHDESYATVKPEEDQPAFSVDSDGNGVYGTYTFEARAKDDPGGPVLAAVSVAFEAGDCYSAAFHRVGDGDYQFSVYEIDFSPSGDTRFEIHHAASPQQIDWTLAPKAEADPRIPVDGRGGSLERGQWQRAIDVTENEYRLEVLVDDVVVAVVSDLELEAERLTVCSVVGGSAPDPAPENKQLDVRSQRFQIPAGPARDDTTTEPAAPLWTADDNQHVRVEANPPVLYETNRNEVEVQATDPDGVVTSLALTAVEPDPGGVRLLDDAVKASGGIGEPATATLELSPNVPPGRYDAHLVTNPDGIGERAVEVVPLEVEPITPDRLWEQVNRYHEAGDVSDAAASELFALLGDAGAAPEGVGGLISDVRSLFESVGGSSVDPRRALERVLDVVDEERGRGIGEAAAEDVIVETEAALEHLGNG